MLQPKLQTEPDEYSLYQALYLDLKTACDHEFVSQHQNHIKMDTAPPLDLQLSQKCRNSSSNESSGYDSAGQDDLITHEHNAMFISSDCIETSDSFTDEPDASSDAHKCTTEFEISVPSPNCSEGSQVSVSAESPIQLSSYSLTKELSSSIPQEISSNSARDQFLNESLNRQSKLAIIQPPEVPVYQQNRDGYYTAKEKNAAINLSQSTPAHSYELDLGEVPLSSDIKQSTHSVDVNHLTLAVS